MPTTNPTPTGPVTRQPFRDRLRSAVLSRPAAIALAAVAGGIVAQGFMPICPMLWLGIAAGLAIGAMLIRRPTGRGILLFLATAMLGLGAAQAQYNRAAPGRHPQRCVGQAPAGPDSSAPRSGAAVLPAHRKSAPGFGL